MDSKDKTNRKEKSRIDETFNSFENAIREKQEREKKEIEGIRNTRDQRFLICAAKSARTHVARMTAIKRIQDDNLLAEIALDAWGIAESANEKYKGKGYQSYQLWKKDVGSRLVEFGTAAGRIYDEGVSFDIIMQVEESPLVNCEIFYQDIEYIRYLECSISRIENPVLLKKIIKKTAGLSCFLGSVIRCAVRCIKDQSLLEEIAEPSNGYIYGYEAAKTAAEMLHIQEFTVKNK